LHCRLLKSRPQLPSILLFPADIIAAGQTMLAIFDAVTIQQQRGWSATSRRCLRLLAASTSLPHFAIVSNRTSEIADWDIALFRGDAELAAIGYSRHRSGRINQARYGSSAARRARLSNQTGRRYIWCRPDRRSSSARGPFVRRDANRSVNTGPRTDVANTSTSTTLSIRSSSSR